MKKKIESEVIRADEEFVKMVKKIKRDTFKSVRQITKEIAESLKRGGGDVI